MDCAIEITKLTKKFFVNKNTSGFPVFPFCRKENITVLENVNIRVRRGEIFALVGLNGAGKTTLLKILSGLILPTSGIATVNGYDVAKDEYKVKSSIGLVTGIHRSLFWRLTGRQNLRFFATLHRLNGKGAKKQIDFLTDLLYLGQYIDRPVMEYSAGMKQKLCLARALLNDAEILLMDEPTKNLDIDAAEKLRHFVRKELVHRRDKTIFFTTHDSGEVELWPDRLAILNKGNVKITGSLREIKEGLNMPGATFKEAFRYYAKL